MSRGFDILIYAVLDVGACEVPAWVVGRGRSVVVLVRSQAPPLSGERAVAL